MSSRPANGCKSGIKFMSQYVLNKNPDESTQANRVLCSLTVSTESDEILFKIDHDLDMIDKHIVNFPKYDHFD